MVILLKVQVEITAAVLVSSVYVSVSEDMTEEMSLKLDELDTDMFMTYSLIIWRTLARWLISGSLEKSG